jgi:hypothetical protein
MKYLFRLGYIICIPEFAGFFNTLRTINLTPIYKVACLGAEIVSLAWIILVITYLYSSKKTN